jgi:hypothetical protein
MSLDELRARFDVAGMKPDDAVETADRLLDPARGQRALGPQAEKLGLFLKMPGGVGEEAHGLPMLAGLKKSPAAREHLI